MLCIFICIKIHRKSISSLANEKVASRQTWNLFRKWDEFEPFFIPAVIANIKKYASLIEFYTLDVFMYRRYRRIFV